MCCFVILLLSNEMQISVRRFSAIPDLRVISYLQTTFENLDVGTVTYRRECIIREASDRLISLT